MSVPCSQTKLIGANILALMAESFFRLREYNRRREEAGIMPCFHVAVVSYGGSSTSCTQSCKPIGYEHHAIFDGDRGEYIYVTSAGDDGEMRVVRTVRGDFERQYSTRPRVVRLPSTTAEAYQILQRARDYVDGENKGRWEYSIP